VPPPRSPLCSGTARCADAAPVTPAERGWGCGAGRGGGWAGGLAAAGWVLGERGGGGATGSVWVLRNILANDI